VCLVGQCVGEDVHADAERVGVGVASVVGEAQLLPPVGHAVGRVDDGQLAVDLDALEEPAFKIKNDPRVTRVGGPLRRASIDEIPQFFNVFRGDMSLVGPRPEEEAVAALYDERQRQRLEVKPGLTGPMQVAGRGDLGFEERLSLERDYVDNLTITGDVSILIRTPRAVIRGDGAF
jgi:lipopolysaccharide/colanic/teichoic acid biosynthesis glycosyltransferase